MHVQHDILILNHSTLRGKNNKTGKSNQLNREKAFLLKQNKDSQSWYNSLENSQILVLFRMHVPRNIYLLPIRVKATKHTLSLWKNFQS